MTWLIPVLGDSDSFTKREKANEDFFIRKQEKEKYGDTSLQAAKHGIVIVFWSLTYLLGFCN